MKLPCNLDGRTLARALGQFGYQVTRQTGSHIRLTTDKHGEHHVTNPDHKPLGVGTLAATVGDVAIHLGIEREHLVRQLFGE